VKRIEDKRPESRRGKTIDVQTNIEVLDDLTFSFSNAPEGSYHSMTIEIKPKSFLYDPINVDKLLEILEKEDRLKIKKDFDNLFEKYFSSNSLKKGEISKTYFTKFFKVQLKKGKDHTT
jgi:hypothetical protein